MNFLESYSKQEDKKKALFTKDNILSYVGYVIIGILAGLMMQADGGRREVIHKIADLNLKGANSETLYLGYLAEEHMFFQTGKEYVLGIVGDSKHYYSLPSQTERSQYNSLPNPLPAYKCPVLTTFFWIYLAGLAVIPAIIVGVKHYIKS